MATPVEVPKLGNTVEECLVARWVKRKGESVSEGDIVAEIETDKATFEVTAPVGGTLLETFFDEGVLVPVFTNLFVIGAPGEAVNEFRPVSNTSPQPVAHASACSVDTRVDVPAREGAPFSPRARRFAEQHDFHPTAVAGSGPNGRILESDLRKIYQAPAPRPAGIRDRIARRMRESLATTAQYTLHTSADATGILALRAQLKARPDLAHVTINDIVTFCTIEALLDVPALNAEYINGEIHQHSDIHIGFACDTPRGLLVPVIRNADALALDELATRGRALAEHAVSGAISPDDLSGATFTLSNLGALGVEQFTPLLNPPQVAILGVGAITLKPVRRDSQIEFQDSIALSLTCDHQVIDGAPGARFLKVLCDKLAAAETIHA